MYVLIWHKKYAYLYVNCSYHIIIYITGWCFQTPLKKILVLNGMVMVTPGYPQYMESHKNSCSKAPSSVFISHHRNQHFQRPTAQPPNAGQGAKDPLQRGSHCSMADLNRKSLRICDESWFLGDGIIRLLIPIKINTTYHYIYIYTPTII